MGVHLGPSFWSVRELKIKKMERAVLFKVLVIIAVLAVHIEAAGHEQNGGGSNIRRPRPPRPSRPPQQPSTDQEQEQEHTHEEVEREESMEVSDPEHGGPDCPYKKKYKYKKKYGGYKKYGGGYKKKYGGYKKYDDYGYGGYKKYDDYGYGGYKNYGGQKYGGGYGSYGGKQYGGGYGSYGGGYGGQQYGGQRYGGQQYGDQQYGVYNQGYQKIRSKRLRYLRNDRRHLQHQLYSAQHLCSTSPPSIQLPRHHEQRVQKGRRFC